MAWRLDPVSQDVKKSASRRFGLRPYWKCILLNFKTITRGVVIKKKTGNKICIGGEQTTINTVHTISRSSLKKSITVFILFSSILSRGATKIILSIRILVSPGQSTNEIVPGSHNSRCDEQRTFKLFGFQNPVNVSFENGI